ncbi:hypothetical protein PY365_10795 [Roseiarcaceae bacterium H3SJ34-1]|uniref:hypothetical protein n=1 Tax=Terripilifer ovatus TaxID=3032367 RepID=UPI003AB97081|nr:hypothetical protein [Roseiarcaceae bacterium H3SJ34-1]
MKNVEVVPMMIGRRSFLATMTSSSLVATSASAQPLGAAGPKIRQSNFDLVRDFGAVGDGATDNAEALKSFNAAAQKESTAGRGVVLNVPPGVYNFNHARCFGFLLGIRHLAIYGHGAAFQNTYDPTVFKPSFGAEQAWGFASYPDRTGEPGKKINSVSVGSSKLQLKSPSDSNEFLVGDWALIGSLDIQYYGVPPNFHYFEYVKISEVDQSTGSITIEQKTRWPHRDDFPDSNKRYGQARLWNMKSKTNIPWDVSHIYYGLEIRNAPKTNVPYITAVGMDITYEHCVLPGLSQSGARRVVVRGGAITAGSEPDKLVDQCVYDSVNIQKGVSFQSSSINSASFRDCYVDGVLLIGQVKNFHAQNCDIEWLAEGGVYGLNLIAGLENCLVHRMDGPIRNYGSENIVTKVDGDKVKFANGRFTIAKGFNNQAYWNSVPGAALNLRAAKGNFSGQLGTGYITSITEDETHMHWETTLPYKELPEWTDGTVRIQKAGRIRIVNCTGCASVAMASDAAAVGKEPWEYRRFVFLGVTDQAGYFAGCDGILKNATINVIQRGAVQHPDAKLVFTQYGAVTSDGMTDPQTFAISIDISEAGIRKFSTNELAGKKGKDSVKLSGKDLSALPHNRHCWNVLNWAYVGFVPSASSAGEMPIIEVILEFDSGLFRNGIPMGRDAFKKSIAGISSGVI